MVFGNGVNHALAATDASVAARHRQINPGFIDEFKPLGRQLGSVLAIMRAPASPVHCPARSGGASFFWRQAQFFEYGATPYQADFDTQRVLQSLGQFGQCQIGLFLEPLLQSLARYRINA